MAEFRLETERLILRDWRGDADWDEFFRVTNTPAVMQWLGDVLDDAGRAKQRARVEACRAKNGFCFVTNQSTKGFRKSPLFLALYFLPRRKPALTTLPEFLNADLGMRIKPGRKLGPFPASIFLKSPCVRPKKAVSAQCSSCDQAR